VVCQVHHAAQNLGLGRVTSLVDHDVREQSCLVLQLLQRAYAHGGYTRGGNDACTLHL
jgi:hypothetical protein